MAEKKVIFEYSLRDKLSAATKNAANAVRGLDKNTSEAANSLRSFTRQGVNPAVSSLHSLKNAVGTAFAASQIVGFGKSIMNTGAEFEQSMANVKALTGATASQFETLENKARQLGSSTTFSASKAADAMGFLAMAGFRTNQIMEALPDTLNLAAATGIEVAQAADIASNALSAYSMEASELGVINDIIAKTTTTANTNVTQFAEAFKYVAPIAKSAGIDIKELSAGVGLLGNAGIQGSQAGTTLRGAISRLLKPARSAQQALDGLGISTTDSQGNMRSLTDIIGQLNNAGANTRDIITIFGQEAAAGMQVLVSQGGEALSSFANSLNETGVAARMAKIRSETYQGKVKELQSAVEGFAITQFKDMQPALIGTVGLLTQSVRWLQENKDTVQLVTTAVLGAAAAYGTYMLASQGATAVQWLMNAAMTANPIGAFIGVLGAATAGVIYAWNNVDGFRETLLGTWNVIKALFAPTMALSKALFAINTLNFSLLQDSVGELKDSVLNMDLMKAYSKPFIDSDRRELTENRKKAESEFKQRQARDIGGLAGSSSFPAPPSGSLPTQSSSGLTLPAANRPTTSGIVSGNNAGGGKAVNVTIKVNSLVQTINFNTTNIKESASMIKNEVNKALMTSLNDAQIAAGV